MPRWYAGFHCQTKGRDTLIKQITNQVEHNNLSQLIPVMLLEKDCQAHEFYLFLGIESAVAGEVPAEVRATLLQLPALRKPFKREDHYTFEPFTLEQIRSIVRAEFSTYYNYVRLIPYAPNKIQALNDPFTHQDKVISSPNIKSEDILLRSRRYDRLLFWLSAVGKGTWQTFQNACSALGLEGRQDAPSHILRRMRLLGHIETSADRAHWFATASILVQSSDVNMLFLCGQRDNATIQKLRNIAQPRRAYIEEIVQPHGEAPALILCHIDENISHAIILRMGHMVRFEENVALHLAQILPSLSEWKRTLEMLPHFSPYQYQVKQFFGTDFKETDFDKNKSGFYQFWPLKKTRSAADQPEYTLFYDAEHNQFLRGGWYALRFLALQTNAIPCPVVYDEASRRLAIPWDWRWPELYERVLVLASGKLPTYWDKWLIYESITLEILAELVPKLNLNCKEEIESCMMS